MAGRPTRVAEKKRLCKPSATACDWRRLNRQKLARGPDRVKLLPVAAEAPRRRYEGAARALRRPNSVTRTERAGVAVRSRDGTVTRTRIDGSERHFLITPHPLSSRLRPSR